MSDIETEKAQPRRLKRMVRRLHDEADLCRNETATDVADLLDEAAAALEQYWSVALEHAATIAERYPTQTNAGEDVADGIAATIREEAQCHTTK